MKLLVTLILLLCSLARAQELWPQPLRRIEVPALEGKDEPDFATAYAGSCDIIKKITGDYSKLIKKEEVQAILDGHDTFTEGIEAQMKTLATKCGVELEALKLFNIYIDLVAPVPDKDEKGQKETRKSGSAAIFRGHAADSAPVLISSELTQVAFEDAKKIYVEATFKKVTFRTVIGYFGAYSFTTPAISAARTIGRTDVAELSKSWHAAATLPGVFMLSLMKAESFAAAKELLDTTIDAKSIVPSTVFFSIVGQGHDDGLVAGANDKAYRRTFTQDVWLLVQSTYKVQQEKEEGYASKEDEGVAATVYQGLLKLKQDGVERKDNAKKQFYLYPVRTERTISIVQSNAGSEMEHCQSKVNSRRVVSDCTDALPLFDAVYFTVSILIIITILAAGGYGIFYAKKFDKMVPGDYQTLLDSNNQ